MDEQQTQKPTSGGDWSIYGVLGIFLIAAYYVLRVVQRRTAAIPNRTSQSTSDEWDPLAAGSSITFVYENKFRDDYDNMNTEGTPVNLLAPVLLRRAMVTIGHVMELQSRRQTLQSLVQSGSIGEDVWKSFLAAEEFVGEEIQTIVAEADSLKPGWGQHIMPQAQQLLQAELEKHAAAEHLENEQLQKRREEERKIREEIDAKEKRIKAEQAAKELLLEEEREKLMQSQRQRKSSSSKS